MFDSNNDYEEIENEDEEDQVEEEEEEEKAQEDHIDEEEDMDNLPDGTDLTIYFEELQSRLAREGFPSEYTKETFWIEPVNSFFALMKCKSNKALYRPRVFLWLPHHLLANKMKDLQCPKCNNRSLEVKGFNKNPHARKIVDLSSCFYLMSTRYICTETGCATSLNAHDNRIIQQLPLELQMEFPAVLSSKGGVSKVVADLLRPCMQNSMGPQRFQKVLREMHVLRHDRLELQYLLSAFSKKSGVLHFQAFEPYSTFDDPTKYAGYVPTAAYFRTLYTAIIQQLQPKMDKQIMLLDGKVLKGDHSFKFPKHMAKIEEAGVFTALYTVTNEYEEIVHQVLVPSKSLLYLKHSLQKMKEAYELYGHAMPVAFFTDNVKSDKAFFESIFESLKVAPVIQSSESIPSESLKLPEDTHVEYINRDIERMDDKIKSLTDSLNADNAAGKKAVVGFDMEWNDERGNFVDLIQLAYDKTIYVLHIDRSWDHLPNYLTGLLRNRSFKKVGRNIGGDFARLKRMFHFESTEKIELGSFCSRRKIVANGTASLSTLSFQLLGHPIDKGPRQSQWDTDNLSSDLIQYAAVDAWASLAIYNAAKDYLVPGTRIRDLNCPVGTYVGVRPPRCMQPVAFGELLSGERIAMVKITKVAAPGYILPMSNTGETSNNASPLHSFGTPPFELNLPIGYLIAANKESVSPNLSSMGSTTSSIAFGSVSTTTSIPPSIPDSEIDTKIQEMFGESINNIDKNGFKSGYKQFSTVMAFQPAENVDEVVYSRVVKDIFHLMDMIKPYKKHTLYKQFTRKFSESLFTIDENDKESIIRAFELEKRKDPNFPHTWESKMKYDRTWLWKRVRRKVAPPHVLLPLLKSLFLSFGPLKCSKSGRALFDKKSWEQATSVLKTVQLGHVSDPPDVQLYVKTGKKDKFKLTLYRCIRGTNSLEGGVHQNLIRKFGSFGAGPELANAMLTEYRLRHNTDVGSLNRYSVVHNGHYDPWLLQHIDLLRSQLAMTTRNDNSICLAMNALKYCGSDEVYGICPLPDVEMTKLGIEKRATFHNDHRNSSSQSDRTIPVLKDTVYLKIGSTLRTRLGRYEYVAFNQQTKHAVISVHTLKETLEFERNYKENYDNVHPKFSEFASKFNSNANGIDIFYKTPDHLEKYYKQYTLKEGTKMTNEIHDAILADIEAQVENINQPRSLLTPLSPNIPSISNASAIVPTDTIDAQLPAARDDPILPPREQRYEHHPHQLLPTQLPISRQPNLEAESSITRNISPRPTLYHPYSHPYHFSNNSLNYFSSNRLPVVLRTTARTCKGCGRNSCEGKNNRSKCNEPRCLKCSNDTDCPGIWNEKKCIK
ncbi:hypothetical protein [Parasitella parasitica]|nr:hypothetical protein [Parasitella parasitica]